MRISYNWLKDYIDVKLPAEKLAATLTMAGLTVDAIHEVSGDKVMEVEITSNRADWLSYIGVARELSALTGAKLKIPSAGPARKAQAAGRGQISVKVEDKKLCPRYTGRVIRNVKVGESPAWLKSKIEAMGLRPVNNIVDITNFCLFETGEPMHAFDLDKIEGAEIVVRIAKRGEKIVTIDGVERSLDESNLVIADAKKPVAIAGVMGGLNTEVNYSTKNILLEAAYFDPISTRRTSRRIGTSTESSYRFERKVDIANILYSSDRAAGLIQELSGGSIETLVDIGQKASPAKTVELSYERLDSILGIGMAPARAKKILSSLGLKIKSQAKGKAGFAIPAFRQDLNYEIDLIEEIARIYGYDKIPTTIPAVIDQPARLPREMAVEKMACEILVALGMDEIITYSLIGKKMLALAAIPEEGIAEISNPLTAEQEIMRPSLIPGLLNALMWNMNRKIKDLKLFEIGKIYAKGSGKGFSEKRFLSLGMAGEIANWASPPRPVGFFDLKGVCENLFLRLGIKAFSFKATKKEGFSASACAVVEIGGRPAGVMGEISKKAAGNFDIKEAVYACEISLDAVIEHARLEKNFAGLPKYPSVFRDISLIVARHVSNEDLMNLMRSTASPTLKETGLIDRYEGKQIPDGKVSLTYRLEYQDLNKTLEEKQVSEVHARVLRALDEKFGAKLR